MVRRKKRFRRRTQDLYRSMLRSYRNAQAALSGAYTRRIYTWIPEEVAEVQVIGRVVHELGEVLGVQPPSIDHKQAAERFASIQEYIGRQSALLSNSDFLKYASPGGKRRVSSDIVKLSGVLADARKDLESAEIIEMLEVREC